MYAEKPLAPKLTSKLDCLIRPKVVIFVQLAQEKTRNILTRVLTQVFGSKANPRRGLPEILIILAAAAAAYMISPSKELSRKAAPADLPVSTAPDVIFWGVIAQHALYALLTTLGVVAVGATLEFLDKARNRKKIFSPCGDVEWPDNIKDILSDFIRLFAKYVVGALSDAEFCRLLSYVEAGILPISQMPLLYQPAGIFIMIHLLKNMVWHATYAFRGLLLLRPEIYAMFYSFACQLYGNNLEHFGREQARREHFLHYAKPLAGYAPELLNARNSTVMCLEKLAKNIRSLEELAKNNPALTWALHLMRETKSRIFDRDYLLVTSGALETDRLGLGLFTHHSDATKYLVNVYRRASWSLSTLYSTSKEYAEILRNKKATRQEIDAAQRALINASRIVSAYLGLDIKKK